jgi:hypothetical protein
MPAEKGYLAHLGRGADLLRGDKVDEARGELEQANQLRPGDGRIMNLLGLTYFRLARYSEAQGIYAELVRRAPDNAALRLNLGLVYLKRGDTDEAIRELLRARDLDPAQLRTMGYLGLAFARKGRYALARDAFSAAGQDELAKEMDQQLAADMARPPTVPPNGSLAPPPIAPPDTPTPPAGMRRRTTTSAGLRAVDAGAAPIPVPITVPPSQPVVVAAPLGGDEKAAETLTQYLRRCQIRAATGTRTFEVSGQALIVRVRGRVYTRTDGLLVSAGALEHRPALKRVRGRITDDPFGAQGRALSVVSGVGHLVALPRGGAFAAVELVDDVLYLREQLVYGFEERLSWENGHVPGSNAALPVVQLRGDGVVAIRSSRPLLTVEVTADRPLRVDADVLAGWAGAVMPRARGPEAGALVECAGEGTVLVEESS